MASHELNTRFEGHQSVMKLFSFLYHHRLATSSYEDIKTSAANIIKEYEFDFPDDLEFEIRSFAIWDTRKTKCNRCFKGSARHPSKFFVSTISQITYFVFDDPCYRCCSGKVLLKIEINKNVSSFVNVTIPFVSLGHHFN